MPDQPLERLGEALWRIRALAIEWGAGMDPREPAEVLRTIEYIADTTLKEER